MRPAPRRITAAVAALTLTAAGVVALAPPASAASGDLLFSEYIEGSSNNKALEIYNPTTAPIDLATAGYSVQQYSNGSSGAGITVSLTGTVAADGVFVLTHGSANPAMLATADQTSSLGLFNGNDAVALVKGGAIVDILGQIGVDPGSEWGADLTSTADNTLRRAADICVGDADGANAFDPAMGWTGFAKDTADGLGAHDADCALAPDTDPDPVPVAVADCDLEAVTVGSVQGSGAAAPGVGQVVRIEGTVVGDFQQSGGFDGFYVQDAGDGDTATSDGIFVHAVAGSDVNSGDLVSVAGTVTEFFGLTELAAPTVDLCATGTALPAAAPLDLPATNEQREALEGMYVSLPQSLAILEYFEYGRFGTLELGIDRQYQPTATFAPGSPEAAVEAANNLLERITLDDGMNKQNIDPLRHPNGEPFSLDNSLRGGDLVTDATGVLDWRFSTWAIQPTKPATFTVANPRPEVPEVGGDLVVSSFNVLNYFTTLNLAGPGDDAIARGAESPLELSRQQAKIIDALAEIDADVFGLIEIENNADVALKTLTAALNARLGGTEVYKYVATGKIGTDVITTALMYKPATVEPLGAFKLMNGTVNSAWDDSLHRPALTQTFGAVETGEKFTVVVNHLKSKGSACPTGNDPQQGNCNGPRTSAAQALATWLATDPTGQQTVGRELIIGDLNSYDKEDPITALTNAGYTDLLLKYQGEDAYTYVFDGHLGYLDHGLSGPKLLTDIMGAAPWNVNSDEPDILDYNTNYKSAAQVEEWFAPDAYRSSDHDPVIVGIDLDTVPPTISATTPAKIWPPNDKPREVTITVDAADDSGEVAFALTDTSATGNKKAEITQLTKTTFSVIAAIDAVYTFTYEAKDAAGNTAETTVEVRVGR